MYCIFLHFIWLAIGLIVLCPVNKKGLHFLQNDMVIGLKRGLYIRRCDDLTCFFFILRTLSCLHVILYKSLP